jgi:putative flippase GtrA
MSLGDAGHSDSNPHRDSLRRLWRRYREQVLFLVVGGWNTIFQFACFSILYYLLQDLLHPDVIVLLSYLIASVNGFLCFRWFVFRAADRPLMRYLRYNLIYVPLLLAYMFVLPWALAHTAMSAYAMQALFTLVAIVLGYVGNKYFAFRVRAQEHD